MEGYTTSDNDPVIDGLRLLGKTVLPATVHVALAAGNLLGHGFEETYCNAQLPARKGVLGGNGVLFISAAQLLLDLGAQESARALERRLKHYAKIGLLILDEIGFLAFAIAMPTSCSRSLAAATRRKARS